MTRLASRIFLIGGPEGSSTRGCGQILETWGAWAEGLPKGHILPSKNIPDGTRLLYALHSIVGGWTSTLNCRMDVNACPPFRGRDGFGQKGWICAGPVKVVSQNYTVRFSIHEHVVAFKRVALQYIKGRRGQKGWWFPIKNYNESALSIGRKGAKDEAKRPNIKVWAQRAPRLQVGDISKACSTIQTQNFEPLHLSVCAWDFD